VIRSINIVNLKIRK